MSSTKKEFDIWTSELATSNLLIEQKSSKQRRLKAELFTQGQEAFRLGCSFSDNHLWASFRPDEKDVLALQNILKRLCCEHFHIPKGKNNVKDLFLIDS